MKPSCEWPDGDEEQQLLTRLTTGIPTAREEIAVRYLPLLMQFLASTFPRDAADLCDDAADRALIDFLSAPARFDPTRGGLGAYLRMAARGDLANLREQERRARRGIALNSVAEPADHRNQICEDELTLNHPRLVAERAAFNAEEQTAYELLTEDVSDTATFAQRLNFDHLPWEEQVVAVKRVKDRVKKRLVRAVEDLR